MAESRRRQRQGDDDEEDADLQRALRESLEMHERSSSFAAAAAVDGARDFSSAYHPSLEAASELSLPLPLPLPEGTTDEDVRTWLEYQRGGFAASAADRSASEARIESPAVAAAPRSASAGAGIAESELDFVIPREARATPNDDAELAELKRAYYNGGSAPPLPLRSPFDGEAQVTSVEYADPRGDEAYYGGGAVAVQAEFLGDSVAAQAQTSPTYASPYASAYDQAYYGGSEAEFLGDSVAAQARAYASIPSRGFASTSLYATANSEARSSTQSQHAARGFPGAEGTTAPSTGQGYASVFDDGQRSQFAAAAAAAASDLEDAALAQFLDNQSAVTTAGAAHVDEEAKVLERFEEDEDDDEYDSKPPAIDYGVRGRDESHVATLVAEGDAGAHAEIVGIANEYEHHPSDHHQEESTAALAELIVPESSYVYVERGHHESGSHLADFGSAGVAVSTTEATASVIGANEVEITEEYEYEPELATATPDILAGEGRHFDADGRAQAMAVIDNQETVVYATPQSQNQHFRVRSDGTAEVLGLVGEEDTQEYPGTFLGVEREPVDITGEAYRSELDSQDLANETLGEVVDISEDLHPSDPNYQSEAHAELVAGTSPVEIGESHVNLMQSQELSTLASSAKSSCHEQEERPSEPFAELVTPDESGQSPHNAADSSNDGGEAHIFGIAESENENISDVGSRHVDPQVELVSTERAHQRAVDGAVVSIEDGEAEVLSDEYRHPSEIISDNEAKAELIGSAEQAYAGAAAEYSSVGDVYARHHQDEAMTTFIGNGAQGIGEEYRHPSDLAAQNETEAEADLVDSSVVGLVAAEAEYEDLGEAYPSTPPPRSFALGVVESSSYRETNRSGGSSEIRAELLTSDVEYDVDGIPADFGSSVAMASISEGNFYNENGASTTAMPAAASIAEVIDDGEVHQVECLEAESANQYPPLYDEDGNINKPEPYSPNIEATAELQISSDEVANPNVTRASRDVSTLTSSSSGTPSTSQILPALSSRSSTPTHDAPSIPGRSSPVPTTSGASSSRSHRSVTSSQRSGFHSLSSNISRGRHSMMEMLFGDNRGTSTRRLPTGVDAASLSQSIFSRALLPSSVIYSEQTKSWVATVNTSQRALEKNDIEEGSKALRAFAVPTKRQAICLARAWAPPRMQPFVDNPTCFVCDARFAVFKRACHCRNCGVCICNSCSVQWPSKMLPETYNVKRESMVHICKSCDWLCSAFRLALLKGDFDWVKVLHSTRNINLTTPFANVKGELFYPVHCAALGGNLELLKWLVDENCCPLRSIRVGPNRQKDAIGTYTPILTSKGRSLLGIALNNRNVGMIRYLVVDKRMLLSAEKDLPKDALVQCLDLVLRILPEEEIGLQEGAYARQESFYAPSEGDLSGEISHVQVPRNLIPESVIADLLEIGEDEEDDEDDQVEDACIICFSNSIDCVATPCGHQVCCLECSSNISKCPVCSIQCSFLRVYRP